VIISLVGGAAMRTQEFLTNATIAALDTKRDAWWKRYTFVLSAALDSSIAIAAVIIFFAMFWTKASDHFTWWGTTVYKVSRVRPGLDPKTNSYEGDLRLEVLPLQNSNEGTDIWFLMRTASTL
jgi:hypothetical protein